MAFDQIINESLERIRTDFSSVQMEVILDDTQDTSKIEAYEDIPHHTAREPAESIQVTQFS